jgi:hypothetical protein
MTPTTETNRLYRLWAAVTEASAAAVAIHYAAPWQALAAPRRRAGTDRGACAV